MVGWSRGWLVDQLVACLVGRGVGCMVVGWLVARLDSRSVGRSVSWLVGLSVC